MVRVLVLLFVVLIPTVVLSRSTWHDHGIPLTCDVKVCSYIFIQNDLNTDLTDNTMTTPRLELISGYSRGHPAAIKQETEELIFMKKAKFVARGVVGVLHYQLEGYNATVIK